MTASGPLPGRLDEQFESCRSLLQDLDTADLRRRPPTGKWSALEHLAHLGRYHEVFLQRVQRLVAGGSDLGRYRAEEDPGFAHWTELLVEELWSELRDRKTDLRDFLESLPRSDWDRVGRHPVYGPMPLARLLHFFLVHEGHHLYEAFRAAGLARAGRGPDAAEGGGTGPDRTSSPAKGGGPA